MALSEFDLIEKRMKKHVTTFQEKQNGTYRPPSRPQMDCIHKGLEVSLCVRMKQYSFLDEKFTTVVDTLSEEVAEQTARKLATESGWKWIAYVISIKPKIQELSREF